MAEVRRLVTAARRTARPRPGNTQIWAMMETPEGHRERPQRSQRAPENGGFVLGTPTKSGQGKLGLPQRGRAMHIGAAALPCWRARAAPGSSASTASQRLSRRGGGTGARMRGGRDFGFDGKTLIHPSQIAVTKHRFRPVAGRDRVWRVARSRGIRSGDGPRAGGWRWSRRADVGKPAWSTRRAANPCEGRRHSTTGGCGDGLHSTDPRDAFVRGGALG